jgi:hypothetical protein
VELSDKEFYKDWTMVDFDLYVWPWYRPLPDGEEGEYIRAILAWIRSRNSRQDRFGLR